ncbi:MAG: IS3 family transposase [Candidatus Saganbacteria bacterium]|nr:IS3 family transposase [Candidatus Saganbacteria bacterium]
MVNKLREQGLVLREALDTVGLSKSSFLYKEKKHSEKPLTPQLVEALGDLKDYELVYGYRKVTKWLWKKKKIKANHKAVLRHMQKLKLTQPRKIKGMKGLRQLPYDEPKQSNTRWEGDLTYVWCGRDGQAYLFAFIDGYDNEVLGDCFSQRCRAKEAIEALDKAICHRFPCGIPKGHKLVLRVDRGTQFIARDFREAAEKRGVTLEFCGIRCPDDKPYIESFFAAYKKEEVYRNEYETFMQADFGWNNFKQWYNTERLNQGLDYQVPSEVALFGMNINFIEPEVSLIGAAV